jgi:hypothetical protein
MVYTLWLGPWIHGVPWWTEPGDTWSTVRAAHYVGWGDLGDIYNDPQTLGFIVTPGIAVALAPFAMLSGYLHLSESTYQFLLWKPTAWLVIGPAMMVIGTAPLFALHSWAQRLRIGRTSYAYLMTGAAAVLAPVTVQWGHPEDSVALACVLWGLLAATDHRAARSAWLFGLALAFQPFALLALPIALSCFAVRRWGGMLWRSALPPALLLVAPMVHAFHPTWSRLTNDGTQPGLDYATPFVAFAPVVTKAGRVKGKALATHVVHGHEVIYTKNVVLEQLATVNPSHMRLVVLVGAVLIGLWLRRRGATPGVMAFGAFAVFALWCALEPVIVPYYLAPALCMAVLCVALGPASGRWTGAGCIVVAMGWSYVHTNEWIYWVPLTLALAVLGWLSWRAVPCGTDVPRPPETLLAKVAEAVR